MPTSNWYADSNRIHDRLHFIECRLSLYGTLFAFFYNVLQRSHICFILEIAFAAGGTCMRHDMGAGVRFETIQSSMIHAIHGHEQALSCSLTKALLGGSDTFDLQTMYICSYIEGDPAFLRCRRLEFPRNRCIYSIVIYLIKAIQPCTTSVKRADEVMRHGG